MLQALPPVFAGLSPEDVTEASGLLQPMQLEAGDIIMEQGEDDSTIAFMMSGSASLMVGDIRIGGAGARDVLGLVELYTGRPRSATVVASGPVQLLVLSPDGYAQLCESGNPAVHNLERAAIRRMGERLRWFNDGIAERTKGEELKLKPKVGLFAKLSNALRGRQRPDVDAATVLSNSELFSWADGAVVQQIGEMFDAESFDAEQMLCRQGDTAERMWVVAEGEVDVVILIGADRAERIATLKPGQAFGDATLALGTARTASCVSHEPVVCLTLSREKYLEMYGVDDLVGSTFRQGMARNLVSQLLAAQERYVTLAVNSPEHQEEQIRGTPVSSVWRD